MGKQVYVIEDLEKAYNTKETNELQVIKGLSLKIDENDFICLVGPSGCGKSTLLRMLAGLETPTKGKIYYRDKELKKPIKEIGMVFQNYSLMPWLSVEDNIALGLKFQKLSEKERKERVEHYVTLVGLNKFKKSKPYELSGGMQQRVAIARSLANWPDVILMDEPFGALDAYTRIQLQKELLKIWCTHRKTIIFVTHSVDEAIYLSDRVIMMGKNHGEISLDMRIDLPRERDRGSFEFAQLNQKLLDELEKLSEDAV